MSTLPTALAAFITVGQAYFSGLISDPTYGVMYQTTRFIDQWQPDTFNWPTVAIYEMGAPTEAQGLGTVKAWRRGGLRVDVFGRTAAEARTAFEALRTAWITDFNYFNPPATPTAGQGYLRTGGGIKYLTISDSRALPWEKTGVQFRRLADIQIEIGD